MGKTLKELKDCIESVNASQLEYRINENTLIGKYMRNVDNDIKTMVQSRYGHVGIPTLQNFIDKNEGYKAELIDLYKEKMQGVKGYETVNIETMVAQAALFDNLCYVYDTVKGTYCLATMNFDILYDLDVEYDMLKQVFKKNKDSITKAYRIDVEYLNDDKEFSFKAVNAKDFDIDESKPDGSEGKRFYLVPYLYVVRFMKLFEYLLNKGATLRVHQAKEGMEKVRFISKNTDILSKFCDEPSAVNGLQAKFFPLRGFFYAPVVGAPSTTAMVTNIDIFDMSTVKNATVEDFSKFGVHKPVNPVEDLVAESLVCNKLMFVKSVDIGDFAYMINNFPYRNKYLDLDVDNITEVSISKYLHSITEVAKKKVYKIVGIGDELSSRMKILGRVGTPLSQNDIKNIEDVLKTGICKLIIQKNNCMLSSVFCTNDKNILISIYGTDYVRKYEGFSTKFYNLWNWLESNKTKITEDVIMKACSTWGLPCDSKEDAKYVIDTYSSGDALAEENIKGFFADKMGVNLKRSEAVKSSKDSSNVLARTLTAYVTPEGKVVDYYKFIDKKKIIGGTLY